MTSSVLHLPGTGLARSCSRLMPRTACRKALAPATYASIISGSVDIADLPDRTGDTLTLCREAENGHTEEDCLAGPVCRARPVSAPHAVPTPQVRRGKPAIPPSGRTVRGDWRFAGDAAPRARTGRTSRRPGGWFAVFGRPADEARRRAAPVPR